LSARYTANNGPALQLRVSEVGLRQPNSFVYEYSA